MGTSPQSETRTLNRRLADRVAVMPTDKARQLSCLSGIASNGSAVRTLPDYRGDNGQELSGRRLRGRGTWQGASTHSAVALAVLRGLNGERRSARRVDVRGTHQSCCEIERGFRRHQLGGKRVYLQGVWGEARPRCSACAGCAAARKGVVSQCWVAL